MLSLQGCIVTADALHCHRAMAQTILDRGGDYVLAIKANRRPLFRIVAQQFSRAGARRTATRREPATHDRCETRRATIMRNASLAAVHRFPGVVAIGRITARRRRHGQHADPPLVRYYLLSKYMSAARFLQITAATGPSKTSFIGCSTSNSTRTALAQERTTHQRTLPSCAGSHSTSCAHFLTPLLSVGKSNVLAGTTPSSSLCSVICDSPALKGGGNSKLRPHRVRLVGRGAHGHGDAAVVVDVLRITSVWRCNQLTPAPSAGRARVR